MYAYAWLTQKIFIVTLYIIFILALANFVAELYDFSDNKFDLELPEALHAAAIMMISIVLRIALGRTENVFSPSGHLKRDAWFFLVQHNITLFRGTIILLVGYACAWCAVEVYNFKDQYIDIELPEACYPLLLIVILGWLFYNLPQLSHPESWYSSLPSLPVKGKNTVSLQEHALMAQELAELKKKIETDELTGLLNKAAITQKISTLITEQKAISGVLFMIDMDNFKAVNDTYGHFAGDDVLARTGIALQNAFKNCNALVGRVGGDEFMAFIADAQSSSDVQSMVQRLRQYLQIPIADSGQIFTGSIGTALVAPDDTFESVYIRADSELYKDKKREHPSYQTIPE